MKKILKLMLVCCVFVLAKDYDVYDVSGKKINTIDAYSINDLLIVKKTEFPTSVFKEKNKKNFDLSTHKKQDISLKNIIVDWYENPDTVWFEVEKNNKLEICFEKKQIKDFKTDLVDIRKNDNCVSFVSPSDVRTYQLIVLDSLNESKVIKIAVDMKHLVFKNASIKIGFNGGEYHLKNGSFEDSEKNRVYSDPERTIKLNAEYLVDKYPVTNCEFLNFMKKHLNLNADFKNGRKKAITSLWKQRLERSEMKKNKCNSNDSVANVIYLYQALMYANQRSIAENLEPYYIFEKADVNESLLYSDSSFTTVNSEKKELGKYWVKVSVNSESNGYRLPYYNEWTFIARGGMNDGVAVWGDSSSSLNEVLKYAWFGDSSSYKKHSSKPVGILEPNGYGLYDVFGLVNEFVLFPGKNPFEKLHNKPSCLKGGDYKVRLKHSYNDVYIEPYWKWIDYGYSKIDYGSSIGGFRLVRKIK